jgi:hypothetical protein
MIGRLKTWAAAAGAFIAALAFAFLHGRSQGRTDAAQEAREDDARRMEAGRDAVRNGRGLSPAERLQRNTDARK